jgi:hypothetical protein
MRFKVGISGEHLDRARAALNRADIPTIGPLYYWLSEQEVVESKRRRLLAVLDAETAEEAKARVRDNLPANGNGNYGIGDPETW